MSTRTFYIASSRDGLAEVTELTALLVHRGWAPAFDWTAHVSHRCGADTCGIRESLQTEQTPEDRALRSRILPALIAACAERIR